MLASGSGAEAPKADGSSVASPAAAGSDQLVTEREGATTLPSKVTQQSDVAVADRRLEVESIETILMRSHRDELVQRVGPQVERYLPAEDPNAFLLPANRLEPHERKWQKIFLVVPVVVFACMLAVPLGLVRVNLPWLQERAGQDRRFAEARSAAIVVGRVPEFTVVRFSQMPDVLERPYPTMLLLFDHSTFASRLFLPLAHDLEVALRTAGIKVAVAALDLALEPRPPADFSWEYPSALAPHIQLVIPRARDGEAGIVDYDGRWTAAGLATAAQQLHGPRCPDLDIEELARLDTLLEQLREVMFELLFVEEGAEPDPRARAAEQPSWWRRWSGRGTSPEAAERAAARLAAARCSAEESIDLSQGLEHAIATTQRALSAFRTGAPAATA